MKPFFAVLPKKLALNCQARNRIWPAQGIGPMTNLPWGPKMVKTLKKAI
ncbi:hypothetical protein [Desulfospira joergensenii]|nr:hypothetical protein [Desulfospira joergensenii]